MDRRISLKDHDYCFESFQSSQRPPTPPPALAKIAPAKIVPAAVKSLTGVKTQLPVQAASAAVDDLSEMDKIANNVAMGASFEDLDKKHKRKKDKKKKKKKKRKRSKSSGSR